VKNYSSRSTDQPQGLRRQGRHRQPLHLHRQPHLQPGDYVKLRGGHGTDSDTHNVVYRDNCNFLWNNDQDTIYLYTPSGSRADVHAYTNRDDDPDGNGYINFHG
jgi:hypothetical protein